MQSEVIEGFMLSPQQRSLWSEQQEGQDYRALGAILIEGELRSDLLKRAVHSIIDRHEILRTTFQQSPGMTFPLQVVAEEGAQPSWDESNLEDLGSKEQGEIVAEIFSREGAHRFDASVGPLVRAALLRLDARRHILALNISPLCADSVTLDNIFSQLAAVYDSLAHGGELTAEHIQYADYALWQHELTEGEDVEAGLAYWRGLEFEPLLAQPVPFERHLADASAAAGFDSVAVELEPRAVGGLKTAAQQYDLSTGLFLLACWQTLIGRLTGQQDIVVGIHSDGRKYEDLRGACGPYAKQLPLVIHLKDRSRFSDILAQLKRASAEADEWQEYFNLEAVAAGSPQSPFLPLGFEFDEQPPPFSADGLNWINYGRDVRMSRHKLKLRCTATADGSLRAALDFDPRHVTRDSAVRLAAHFSALASNAAAQPTARIAELELIDEGARRQLLSELNQTSAQFGEARCFHEIFAEQAAQTPERIALVCEDRQLTYAELNRKSNQLARYLRG
ncbi:MAG TPA: condensation domain-containing protein, partial [Pyrinomonadaceae bacterium]